MRKLDTKTAFSWIVIAFIVCRYYYIITKYSMDIPLQDDYDAILRYMIDTVNTDTLKEKWNLLMQPFFEHRLVFTRLITHIQHLIFGSIHFNYLILIGNIFFGLSLIGFYRLIPIERRSLWHYLPVIAFTLHPASFESVFWAMGSLQIYGGMAFFIWSISLTQEKRAYWSYLSILLAFCAIFTSSAGVFLAPIIVLLLFLKKRYTQGITGTIILSLTIIYYFATTEHSSGHFSYVIEEPNHIFRFYSTLLGSAASFHYDLFKPFITGLAILLSTLLFCSINIRKHLQLKGFLFFLLIVTAAISIVRGHENPDIHYALSSRYKVYSYFLICTLYLLIIETLRNTKKIQTAIIVLAIAGALFYHQQAYTFNLSKTIMRNNDLTMGLIEWNNTGNPNGLVYGAKATGAETLKKAKTYSIYSLPDNLEELPGKPVKPIVTVPLNPETKGYAVVRVREIDENHLFADGWAMWTGKDSDHMKIEIYLISKERTYSYPTQSIIRQDVTLTAGKPQGVNLDHSGFQCILSKNDLKKGVYQAGICITRKKRKTLTMTKHILTIE